MQSEAEYPEIISNKNVNQSLQIVFACLPSIPPTRQLCGRWGAVCGVRWGSECSRSG